MRVLGILAVIGACLSVSVILILFRKQEIRCLDGLVCGIRAMRAELSTRLCPMDELLMIASERAGKESSVFFQGVRESLTDLNTQSFVELWTEASRFYLPILSEENRQQLEALGAMLGRYSLDEQLAACDSYLRQSEERLQIERGRYPEQRKLYLVLSAAAGTYLCLLIL